VPSAFHVGYANGRYLYYLTRMGIRAGGTDLPPSETEWTRIPPGVLDEDTLGRLLATDFFDLTPDQVRSAWGDAAVPIGVLFSEATFETVLPWGEHGISVPRYPTRGAEARSRLMSERLRGQLVALAPCFENLVFIEPEREAGGAGEVFARCASR